MNLISTDLQTLAPQEIHVQRVERCLSKQHSNLNQKLLFKAATGNAFTTVFAGFAFTICILPKISRLPALVAGLTRVLILQRPGTVNLPADFTSFAAVSARVLRILPTTLFFNSVSVAKASASAPFPC